MKLSALALFGSIGAATRLAMDESDEDLAALFAASWRRVIPFYERLSGTNRPWRDPFLALIRDLEARYGTRLRAGLSLYTLCLSRSRRHGLSDDQACLGLEPHDAEMTVAAWKVEGAPREERLPIVVSDRLVEVIEMLVKVPISTPIDEYDNRD